MSLHHCRTQSLFLIAIDGLLCLPQRQLVVLDVQRFQDTPDNGLLIRHIENLELGRQPGFTVMQTQKAMTQPMKGSYPPFPCIATRQGSQPRHHFTGGFIGKGHRQYGLRFNLPRLHQPSHARSQHARLATSRARQYQCRPPRPGDCLTLLGIQSFQQTLHPLYSHP